MASYPPKGGGGGGGVPTSRQVIAGTGLTGGGALSSDVTLTLSLTPVLTNVTLVAGGAVLSAGGAAGTFKGLSTLAAGNAGTDFVLNTTNTRSAGTILKVQNNASDLLSMDFAGNVTLGGQTNVAGGYFGGAGVNAYLVGQVTDGATKIANKLGNTNAFSTAGAQILALYSDQFSTKVFGVDLNGKFVKQTAGGNAVAGTATLASGTVTVSTTAVQAGDRIMVSLNTPAGTIGAGHSAPVASIVAGTSFVINAVSAAGAVVVTDTSTVNWSIEK